MRVMSIKRQRVLPKQITKEPSRSSPCLTQWDRLSWDLKLATVITLRTKTEPSTAEKLNTTEQENQQYVRTKSVCLCPPQHSYQLTAVFPHAQLHAITLLINKYQVHLWNRMHGLSI